MRIGGEASQCHARHLLLTATLATLAATLVGCERGTTEPAPGTLAFVVQPSAAVSGDTIPSFQVAVRDRSGSVARGSSALVTLTLAGGPGGATLAGTLTAQAVQGVATFRGLRLDRWGRGYTLVATAPGIGSATSAAFPVAIPFVDFSPGDMHSCGVATGGEAFCWGDNYDGQLGDGTLGEEVHPSPMAVAGGLRFASIESGFRHTCGVTTTGAAYCWGYNGDGELGDGTTTSRQQPVAVAGGIAFASVSASSVFSCGVATDGVAYCWGFNGDGELGDGTTTTRSTPVPVAGGLAFRTVSTGNAHACGLTTAGTIYCWGQGFAGALGDGTRTDRTRPVLVTGGLTFTAMATGDMHSCGIATGGDTYCWGYNIEGQLGLPPTPTTVYHPSPTRVQGSPALSSVSGGFWYTCGMTTSSGAACWGKNTYGELGAAVSTDWSPEPQIVKAPAGVVFTMLRAGGGHACAVSTSHALYCWGLNRDGEVGDGTTTDRFTPVLVTP